MIRNHPIIFCRLRILQQDVDQADVDISDDSDCNSYSVCFNLASTRRIADSL